MKKLVFALVVATTAFAPIAKAQDLPANFDQMVEADMKKWHAPGLGLAVVKDGKTLFAKGYGIKSVKTGELVNADTLFQAGSTTKAFAATALAMLVDEGKIAWDDPVIKHIPELEIQDEYVRQNLTIRDALSHRSGVKQMTNINMFIGKSLPKAWEMMADNGQQTSFRQKWDYNNTIFGLSGRVVERVSGMTFHRFVEERILKPLGMNNTKLLDAEVEAAENRAEAHQFLKGETYEIPYPYIEYSDSAGMMNSTPNDMSKWLEFLLAKGQWNEQQLVSEGQLAETMKPVIFLPPESIYPAAASYDHNYYSYGMAWFAHDFKGHKIAMHTGSIAGMSAIIAIVPEENIGMYAFINSDHIEYRHALMYTILDHLLGVEKTDWSEKLFPIFNPETTAAPRKAESYANLALTDLLGTYTLDGSYDVVIEQRGDQIWGKVGENQVQLIHKDDGSILMYDDKLAHLPRESFMRVVQKDDGSISDIVFGGLRYKKAN